MEKNKLINKINILILESDEEILNMFRDYFSDSIFNLSIIKNTNQAIELIKSKSFTLIISELFIGEVVTTRLINYLNEFNGCSAPLILTNSFFDQVYQDRIKEKCPRINETIVKPFNIKNITDILKKLNFYTTNGLLLDGNTISSDVESITIKSHEQNDDNFKQTVKSYNNGENQNDKTIVNGNIELNNNDELSLKKLDSNIDETFEEKSLDINVRDKLGRTPLMIFSEKGDIDNVKMIIDKEATIDLKCKNGRTALHYAAMSDNLELFKYLVEKGLKANSKDSINAEPIYYSIISKSNSILEYLISSGIRVQGRVKGKTYLMIAASKNNLRAVKTLITSGADINLVDEKGKTARDMAKKRKYIGAMKIIDAFKNIKMKKSA